MTERTVRVRKAGGGSTIPWQDQSYSWLEPGSVTEVPEEFALQLLRIPGAGFTVAEDDEQAEVTEPAPVAGDEVTEPAPKPAKPAAERPPRRAGGRTRSAVPSSQD